MSLGIVFAFNRDLSRCEHSFVDWEQDRQRGKNAVVTQHPHGTDVWKTVSAKLDMYVSQLHAVQRMSCQRSSSALQKGTKFSACTRRLRAEFWAVVQELSIPTVVVGHIFAQVEGLIPPEECQRANWSVSAVEPEWGLSRQVTGLRLRGLWDQAEDTLQVLQRLDEDRGQRANRLQSPAEGEAYSLQLLAHQGGIALGKTDVLQAMKTWEKLFYLAIAGKYETIAAQTAIDLYEAKSADAEALRWRTLAASMVRRIKNPRIMVRWHKVQGLVALRHRDCNGAILHFIAAIAGIGDRVWERAYLQTQLGASYADCGDIDNAMARTKERLSFTRPLVGMR